VRGGDSLAGDPLYRLLAATDSGTADGSLATPISENYDAARPAYLRGGCELFGETVARDSILDPGYLDEAVLYECIERVEIFCGYLARHSALPF
jgi:hypothetical protein